MTQSCCFSLPFCHVRSHSLFRLLLSCFLTFPARSFSLSVHCCQAVVCGFTFTPLTYPPPLPHSLLSPKACSRWRSHRSVHTCPIFSTCALDPGIFKRSPLYSVHPSFYSAVKLPWFLFCALTFLPSTYPPHLSALTLYCLQRACLSWLKPSSSRT